MATLKAQIESHLPAAIPLAEEPLFLGWLNEAQRILIHIVDEKDGKKYLQSYTVPVGGLDVDLFRFITPHKNSVEAGMYPSFAYSALVADPANSGIYSASAGAPAAVIHNSKIYIFPGGGNITAFGVVSIANLTIETIKGMPISFGVACVYYAAIQAYKKYLMDLQDTKANATTATLPGVALNIPTLSKEAFVETLTLAAMPAAPADANITAPQAAAPSVSAPTLTAPDVDDVGNDVSYQKVNPTLNFTEANARQTADDIEMLNGEIGRLSRELELYQQQIAEELNRVQTLIQGFQSKVQHSLEQGRLTFSATDSQARLKLDQELGNARNSLQAAIEEQGLILRNYNAKIQATISENQNLINAFEAKMTKWAKDNDLNVAAFQGAIQTSIANYQGEVQKAFQHYQNQVNEVAFNNQVIDQKMQLYLQQIAQLTQQFERSVTVYIRSIQQEKYIPAPIQSEGN